MQLRYNWIRKISPVSIGGKFRFAMSMVIIFLVLVLSAVAYLFLEDIFLRDVRNKARTVTQVLAHSSVNGMLAQDFLIVQELIDTMAGQADIWDAVIFDKNGEIFTMYQPSTSKIEYAKYFLTNAGPNIKASQFLSQIHSGQRVLVTAVPIFAPVPVNTEFQSLGKAMVVFYLEEVYKNLQITRYLILGIGILTILISLLLATRMAASITRPLRYLINGVRKISSGDLNHQIRIQESKSAATASEVTELGIAFNRMSSSLKKLIDEKIEKENFALLGEFAGFVVHHLKSPLHGIRLALENTKMELEDFSEFETLRQTGKETEQVIHSIIQLENFIKETLDLAKPLALETRETDLNQVVNEVVRDFSQFGANINMDLVSKKLPTHLDIERFKMALANLFSNAVEAVSHSSQPFINVETRNGDNINLIISDNGIGMTEEVLSHIFNPFYTTKGKGNGLGLTIVKKIIEAHGGQINVTSRKNQGTRFNIILSPSKKPQKLFME